MYSVFLNKPLRGTAQHSNLYVCISFLWLGCGTSVRGFVFVREKGGGWEGGTIAMYEHCPVCMKYCHV